MSHDNTDLEALVAQFSARDLPPVAGWNPDVVRTIDMRIDRGGRWYYHGSAIERTRMVALFSTILRRDGNDYFLVTPQEKLSIQVEDAPFIAQLMNVRGEGRAQQLEFTDNVGNVFTAGQDHRLWIEQRDQQSIPYVIVRDELPALLSRAVYYQLADLIIEEGESDGVWSDGVFFTLQ